VVVDLLVDQERTDLGHFPVARLKDRRKPVADNRDSPIGGLIAGIQAQRCLSDGRFPDGFSRNTSVMLLSSAQEATADFRRRR
jgi:hypothetical protein